MHWGYSSKLIENWKSELLLTKDKFSSMEVYKLTRTNLIIGFCAIKENQIHYEVEHLWVLPKYIGKGYGKLLLNKTIEYTVTKQKNIIVTSDPNAVKFYEKMGFVIFDEVESYPKNRLLPVMKRLQICDHP